MPVGFAYHRIICDADGIPCDYVFLQVNAAFEEHTGLRGSDIVGKRVSEVLPDIRNSEFKWIEFYGRIAIDGSSEEFEHYFEPLQRHYRIKAYSSEKNHFVTLFSDVSREKSWYRNLFESARDAILVADTKSMTIMDANERACKMLGYTYGELIGRAAFDIHPSEMREEVLAVASTTANQEKPVESVVLHKDGTRIPVEVTTSSAYTIGGRQVVTGIFRDVTERKQAENALKQREDYLRAILQTTADGFWVVDFSNGRIVEANDAYCRMSGYSRDEMLGLTVSDIDAVETPSETQAHIEKVLERGFDIFETRHRRKDGSVFDVEMSVSHIGHELVCFGRDITSRKRAEEELRKSEEKYRLLVTGMLEGLAVHEVITDDNGKPVDYRFLDANEAYEGLTGLNRQDIVGKTVREVLPNTENYWIDAFGQVAITGKPLHYENYSRELGKHYATVVYSPQPRHFAVIVSDITERKQAEESIRYLSSHDPLTGLHNRSFYIEELRKLDTAASLPLTVVMADLNGLKLINDSFGYAKGDELIRKAAEVIRQGRRAEDIVARIGGDEFIILLPNTDSVPAESIVRYMKELAATQSVGSIDLSISFGYDTRNDTGTSIEEVLKKAEDNMHRHKLYDGLSMRSKTIDIIMNTLFEKSDREMNHSRRVGGYCQDIAAMMQLDRDTISQTRIAGLMHDIGKIGIDENILNKPDRLSKPEFDEIKRHPEIGYRILSSANEFSDIAQYVLEHQEKWDGTGYPRGLMGEEISLQARIIAVADAYDAMTRDRAYRKGLSEEEAMAELRRCAGTQFDPTVVGVFVDSVLK
jgi:diguanylate cyclase (GGDEF)-like protein/PAS domain S-box-containing protein